MVTTHWLNRTRSESVQQLSPTFEYKIFFIDRTLMVHENLLSESVQAVSRISEYSIF